MKIRIYLKSPDCLNYPAVEYAVDLSIKNMDIVNQEYDGNIKYYQEDKCREFYRLMEKWFEYGESVTLEFDTELNTCIVLEN